MLSVPWGIKKIFNCMLYIYIYIYGENFSLIFNAYDKGEILAWCMTEIEMIFRESLIKS